MLKSVITMAFDAIADNRNPRSLAAGMRKARAAVVESIMNEIPRPCRILDLGGAPLYWQNLGLDIGDDTELTILNTSAAFAPTTLRCQMVRGDARAMPEFDDGEFDLVVSNSVIEHVGNFSDQRLMANEVRRVGKRFIIQTPNRNFPIEPHFLFPYFQFLPRSVKVALAVRYSLGWYPRQRTRKAAVELVDSVNLLNLSEFMELFPEAEIMREEVLGIAKSFVAVFRGPQTASGAVSCL